MTAASPPASVRGVTRLRLTLIDLVIAGLLWTAMYVEYLMTVDAPNRHELVAIPVMALGVLPTLVRRQHPVIGLVGSMATLYVVIGMLEIYQTVPFASMLCGYSVALVVDRRRAMMMGVTLVPFVLLALGAFSEHALISWETARNLALIAVPIVLGVAARDRRAYLAALIDRAETAERGREEEAMRRVGEERLRIARDVHDVVAHAMVAINVQAGVGAHLLRRDPERARGMLLDIKRASGEALSDLRSTLGMLRTDDEKVPVAPTNGIRELEELGTMLAAAGVDVSLDIDPTIAALPTSIGATGYRIVQEALTNVLRHTTSAQARVSMRCEEDVVVIDVVDDGGSARDSAPAGAGSGHGVRGMRERALALGGSLEAGPHAGGGWRVRAMIPVAVPA